MRRIRRGGGRVLRSVLALALAMQLTPLMPIRTAAAVDSTTVKILHPDFHSRLAAKILATVTTPNASRLRIRLTNTAGYSSVLADIPAPTTAEAHVATMNLRNLQAGTYTLASDVLDANGTLIAQKVETFSRAISGSPRVGFDENNALYVDGQLQFPVGTWWGNYAGSWSPQYLPSLKTAGRITTAEVVDGARTPTTFASALDQSAANGIDVVGPIIGGQSSIASFVSAGKSKSALLSWMWMDEPEYSGIGAATVRSWTDQTHANDPHHPVMVNLVGPMFVNQGGSQATARSFTIDRIGNQQAGVVDWYSTDYYPIAFSPNFGMSRQTAYDNFAQHLVNLRAWTKDLYPLKTFIEVGSMPELNSYTVPTPSQVWAQVWIAVAKGVKGISWFPVDSTGSVQTDPGIPAMETKAVSYLSHFAPMLAQADSTKVTRTSVSGTGRVDYTAKEYGGKLYVFAVNRDVSSSATVRFDLTQFSASSVNVYGENRTIAPGSTSFTDTFAPYGVHIYEIAGIGSTPPPAPNAPTGTMSVNNGAASTSVAAATVNSAVTGATEMRIDPGTGAFGAWTTYAASAPITLPAGDGTKTVRVEYRNSTGGVLALSDTITLSTAPAEPAPTGTMSVNGGAAYTNRTSVTVGSSVANATTMRFDLGSGYGASVPYAATHAVTLPAGDGDKTVRVEYRNASGAVLTLADTITLDTVGPSGWFTLDQGAAETTDNTVRIDSYVTGATTMRSDTGSGFGAWRPFQATEDLTLPAGSGVKPVAMQYADDAGNVLDQSSSITLVSPTPAPTGTMRVNDGAAETSRAAVTVSSAVSGATEMRIDPGSGTFGSWSPYTATAPVTLSAGDGVKTVRVEYRNAGGTLSLSDAITLDTVAPSGWFTIDHGAAQTTSNTVRLDSYVTGATKMRCDTGRGYGAWHAYEPVHPATLSEGTGVKPVAVQYADDAGNVHVQNTSIALVSPVVLPEAPSGGMVVNSGADYTAQTAVVVSSNVARGDEMRFDTGSGFGEWVPYAAQSLVTLPFGDGTKTVRAEYRNEGGTLAVSDTIVLDMTSPMGTMNVIKGIEYRTVRIDSDVIGAVDMRVDGGYGYGEWVPYASRMTVRARNLRTTFRAEYRDEAGNVLLLTGTFRRR